MNAILSPADLKVLAKRRSTRQLRPFLRWAGSKQALLPLLVDQLPLRFNAYYEPFLGGGALALLLAPSEAILSDASEALIETWVTLADDPAGVLRLIKGWSFDKETYYRLRATRFSTALERSARFIYLNRGAFNGLYRVNSAGEFNVPWGAPKSSKILDEGVAMAVSQWVRDNDVTILQGDFSTSMDRAGRNDFVFADPPYHAVRADKRDFRHYNGDRFSWEDQERLADASRRAVGRGAQVVVTNSASPEIAELLHDFRRIDVLRRSTLAASSQARRTVVESVYCGGF